jgi:general secretion pathway protein G
MHKKILSKKKLIEKILGPLYVNKRGFTLIEILIVVIIIGLLASLVAPKLFTKVDKARINTAKAQIELLCSAIDTYRLDLGKFPSSLIELRVSTNPKWDGPYLPKDIPLDPWNNPYVYKYPGEHGPYDIISYGADGKPGGEGNDEDIVSWK